MDTAFYLDLCRRGLRMPIGADLVLHESADPEAVKHDAARLGAVAEATARRYGTPLAFPLMDLTLEKADLLSFLGVPKDVVDAHHLAEPPLEETVLAVEAAANRPFSPRITANQGAVRYIAERTDLMPVGMLIGPFSLATKLMADPITPVAMAGAGVEAAGDPGVALVESCLAMAEATVLRSARAQIAAGARAMIVCEPAANIVYLSPRQLRAGAQTFERFVLAPNLRLKRLLAEHGVDLIFHDCGELTTDMVRQFANMLRPAILSLGSSRKLWEDAAVVPPDVVLFGNMPTKLFYSDEDMPVEKVARLAAELAGNMTRCGHPHILGSECDVLYVPGSAATIVRKVETMLAAGRTE